MYMFDQSEYNRALAEAATATEVMDQARSTVLNARNKSDEEFNAALRAYDDAITDAKQKSGVVEGYHKLFRSEQGSAVQSGDLNAWYSKRNPMDVTINPDFLERLKRDG